MNPKIVPVHRNPGDGMLFVRNEGILKTMVRAPLILAGLIAVALTVPIQSSPISRTLDLTLYSDGSVHVSVGLDVDPLDPDLEVDLFGPSVDNFIAVNENGLLLSSEITGDRVTIDTFGSSSAVLDYDIHDLVSKEGRTWSFSLDSQNDYTLLMPPNSIIVGMSAIPSNMNVVDDQTKLYLGSGLSEVNYIFGSTGKSVAGQPDVSLILAGAVVAAAAVAILVMKKRQKPRPVLQTADTPESQIIPLDPDTIFTQRPELREDDRAIVRFLSKNGGQAFESELRKKFLQPRTTMWRAVKRLERQGVIEIIKKELQNLVKLRNELERAE